MQLNKCIIVLVVLVLAGTASALETWQQPYDRTTAGTELLIHFDSYVPTYTNRTYGEDTASATAYQMWLNAPPNTDLSAANPVPYSGFSNNMLMVGGTTSNLSRSLTAVTDVRYGDSSIEMWLNIDNLPETDSHYVLVGSQLYGHWLELRINSYGNVVFRHNQLDGWQERTFGYTLPTDQWHHITVTRTYAATADPNLFDYTASLFVDGSFQSMYAWTGKDYSAGWAPTHTNNRFFIGGYTSDGLADFDGQIDELRLSSRITMIPEPGTVCLLGLGAAVLLRKRR